MNQKRISTAEGAGVAAIADVVLAMRHDMGYSDTEIRSRDVLGVFVNELDSLGKYFDQWEIDKATWDPNRVGQSRVALAQA